MTEEKAEGLKPWKCSGRGKPSVEREQVCDCITSCLYRLTPEGMEHSVKTEEPVPSQEDVARLVEALDVAGKQIEKLAFDIEPPNTVTPSLVMIAQGMRRLAASFQEKKE